MGGGGQTIPPVVKDFGKTTFSGYFRKLSSILRFPSSLSQILQGEGIFQNFRSGGGGMLKIYPTPPIPVACYKVC